MESQPVKLWVFSYRLPNFSWIFWWKLLLIMRKRRIQVIIVEEERTTVLFWWFFSRIIIRSDSSLCLFLITSAMIQTFSFSLSSYLTLRGKRVEGEGLGLHTPPSLRCYCVDIRLFKGPQLLWTERERETGESAPSKGLSHRYSVSQTDPDTVSNQTLSFSFSEAAAQWLKAHITVTLHKSCAVCVCCTGVAPAAVPLCTTRGCSRPQQGRLPENSCFFVVFWSGKLWISPL